MQIVVPMAGRGERFINTGYTEPKPLIKIHGKPMIEYVIRPYPDEDDFVFICSNDDLKTTNMRDVLSTLKPKATIVGINPHTFGPAYTTLLAEKYIKDEEPIIVTYCDFNLIWDYHKFKEFVQQGNYDGCLPVYRGFYPHFLGSTNYAYIRCDKNNNLLEVKEKVKPIGFDRMREFASTGNYYFKKGIYVKNYLRKLIEKKMKLDGQYFDSMAFNLMLKEGLKICVYGVSLFLQWGTPEDLQEYNYWADFFLKQKNSGKTVIPELTNLMPMAGEGKRFQKGGYTLPKPIIPVSGKLMFVQAAKSLPQPKKWIFVVQKQPSEEYGIRKIIEKEFPEATIVVTDKLTEGQASTCLLAKDFIGLEDPLLIATCDCIIVWCRQEFKKSILNKNIDALVFTFRKNPTSVRHPEEWGWAKVDEQNNIQSVSCKTPLSKTPLNDHAIVGHFFFRKSKFFVEGALNLIAKNKRINNEFYVDMVMNELIESGKKVKAFEVIKYIGFGTPNELKSYNFWENCFTKYQNQL